MKKFYALLLAAVMVVSLAACGGSSKAEYKLGMGVVVANGSSTGTAQIDATVAAVVTDKDGKIVACRIDVAQTKLTVTDGVAQDASEVDLRTKVEKKSDYNMIIASGIQKEWYEQAAYFEEQVVGMTVSDVKAIATTVNSAGHTVATDETIAAGCTMSIADIQEAIVKACEDEYAKSFTAAADSFKLGLDANTSVDSSTASATAEADGSANLYTDFCAVVVDNDGKILATLLDAIQPKIAFNTLGEITGFTFNGTKKELKEDYGMVKYNSTPIGKEWYEQATFFEDQMVGKTSAEVSALATAVNEEGNESATDTAITAGCTISVGGFKTSIVDAIAKAN